MKVIYAILHTMFTETAYAQTEIPSFQLEGDSIIPRLSLFSFVWDWQGTNLYGRALSVRRPL